jgi:Arc/MetJ-type ribon-helix-helix transcriptional regulator
MSVELSETESEQALEAHVRALVRLCRDEGIGLARLALLASAHDVGKASSDWLEKAAHAEEIVHGGSSERSGKARKVSVSMPEDLTAAVQQRVGRGEFSQYVATAVARQLELDLLAELSALLEADHGAVPEGVLAEAEAAWPDAG